MARRLHFPPFLYPFLFQNIHFSIITSMKNILIALGATLLLTNAIAQNAADAVRFSILQPGGTARTIGVGGAFTALGADFSSVSLNPAGLGMYRSDEFMVSPGFRFASTEASSDDSPVSSDEATRFNFGNLGFVFNTTPSSSSKWRAINIGIGYNQLASYRQSSFYEGEANGTVLNNWFADAEATGSIENFDPFGAGMAYDAQAIYLQDGFLSYDFVNTPQASLPRAHSLNTYGNLNELAFAVAGNYDDRIMLGATLGVPVLSYRQEAAYSESDPSGQVEFFENLEYTDYLRINGFGINAKLGASVRVNQALRLGAAFHSPTFFSLTDNYSNTLSYTYSDLSGTNTNSAESPNGTFNYKLRTPMRAMFGGALLLKKMGFVSADVEWVDYSNGRFNLTSDVANTGNQSLERDLNNQVNANYRSGFNYRFGAELAKDVFRLRAGYNLLSKTGATADGFTSAWTAGLGLRGKKVYLDMAYRRRAASSTIVPYADENAPVINADSKLNDLVLTFGFKF
jgi:hypothetical protein